MDPVDNHRATSLKASLEAKRELLKKYRNDQGRKVLREQVEASRVAKLPASSLKNSIDGGDLEEDAMENAEVNDRTLRRRLGGLDEKEGAVESVGVEVRLL